MANESQAGGQSGVARPAASRQKVKVGVLSDTHGWVDPNVQEVLAGADRIVHAGDVMGRLVLQSLEDLVGREQVVAVAGNNDIGGNGSDLPTVAEIPLPGGMLVVTHGDQFGMTPPHEKLREAWPDARAVIYGHTHRLVCDQESLPWVLNPGAAGRTRVRAGPSCLMLTAGEDGWMVEARQFALSDGS